MEYLFIYCLQLFDFLHNAMFFLFFSTFVGIVAYFMAMSFRGDYMLKSDIAFNKMLCKTSKNTAIISLILFILFALTPTKNTLLLVGGTYYGKKAVKQAVTNDKLQKIDTIINLELDKRIKELKNVR